MIELFKNNWLKNLSKCFIPMAYVVGQNTLGLVLHQFNWPNLGQSSRFYAHNNNKKGSSELLFSNSEGASELGCKRNSIDIANPHCCFMIMVIKLPGLKTAIALRQPHSLPSGESCLYLLINSYSTTQNPTAMNNKS